MKMTEAQAVGFFHGLLRFGVQPGLDRIRALCRLLGDPQNALSFVHVAGTNGKGSVCTELASVLQRAGYKTGLYTSPYVIDFRERIRCDGEMISPEDLADVTVSVKDAVEALNGEGVYPTEFEAITAAAFLYFKARRCDVVVLETGLGGRFDATNVIVNAAVCAVTSISLDHTAVLGDTIEKIAAEKAGIIKPGVPVVTTPSQPPAALNVLRETARERGAAFLLSESEDAFAVVRETLTGAIVRLNGRSLRIPFPGRHQLQNTAIVLAVIGALRERGWTIPDEAVGDGIARSFIPARTELFCEDPPVLLDGSHNEGSTAALSAVLKNIFYDKKVLTVMGMMADKDRKAVFSNLLSCFTKVICVTPSNPRALPADMLAREIRSAGVPAEAIDDPVAGVEAALEALPAYDALVVCGSLYLAGDVRPYLLKKFPEREIRRFEI